MTVDKVDFSAFQQKSPDSNLVFRVNFLSCFALECLKIPRNCSFFLSNSISKLQAMLDLLDNSIKSIKDECIRTLYYYDLPVGSTKRRELSTVDMVSGKCIKLFLFQ